MSFYYDFHLIAEHFVLLSKSQGHGISKYFMCFTVEFMEIWHFVNFEFSKFNSRTFWMSYYLLGT